MKKTPNTLVAICALVAILTTSGHEVSGATAAQTREPEKSTGALDELSPRFVLAQQQVQRRIPQPQRPGARPQPQTPDDPGELGNPDRPQEAGIETEPFSIDFKEVPLIDVIRTIGLKTGLNFEIDQSVGSSTVTVISHHPVPPDLAYQLLESLLASRDLVMVPTLDGNLIKIVPKGQNPDKIRIYVGNDPPEKGFDDFLIQVVQVQFADATEIAELLKQVGSQTNVVTVYSKTNTLIINDNTDGLRNMLQLLKELDLPGHDTDLEIFFLDYVRAEVIAQQIEQVLLESAAPNQPDSRRVTAATRTQIRTARPSAIPGQQSAQIIGSAEEVLRIVSDERLNALIVTATEAKMEQVRYLIEQLDTPTPVESNNWHYVPLLNANAEQVEEALQGVTGTTPRQSNQAGGGGGAAGTTEVQPFEKEVTITRYEENNALLILAAPQDFKVLKDMIDLLDVPRRQVLVEARILEVTITDRFELSVELSNLTSTESFSLSNIANLTNAIAGGPLAVAGLGATFGIIDGTSTVPIPGVPDVNGIPGLPSFAVMPNIPLLLKALETVTDVEVLSHATLTTVDNEEAKIVVGQEIPLLSSLSDTDDRTGFSSRSRIQREEVGVKMTVTPQINEGDYVFMEINVEVSQPVQSTIGIDPNQIGATLQISEITNKVIIQDGHTAFIGGLLREGRDRTVSQVPLLGDIPILSFFFRGRVNARNKQNLVVLLTPHIIKEGHDMQRLTDFRVSEYYKQNIDLLFEKGGFLKKIKKKRRLRNNYHPINEYGPGIQNRVDFTRGDMQVEPGVVR